MVAPLKDPSKILTGMSTNRGPTSVSDILGPSTFLPLDFFSTTGTTAFGSVEEEVASVEEVGGGVSRICRGVWSVEESDKAER